MRAKKAFAYFVIIIIALLIAALIAGCGSAQVSPEDDTFKNECIAAGGTYTEFESEHDSCSYTSRA